MREARIISKRRGRPDEHATTIVEVVGDDLLGDGGDGLEKASSLAVETHVS